MLPTLVRAPIDRSAAAPVPLRVRRISELRTLLAGRDAQDALAEHGTPLLLLDTRRVRAQYRRLTEALPFVRLHYAIKALDHPAVLTALAAEGASFDVASDYEIALTRAAGVGPRAVIHTHPIKTPAEIARAVAAGIRLFVVDNPVELAKFAPYAGDPRGIRVLIRLAYRNPDAKSDLSSKFGADPDQARALVSAAVERRIAVAGFSMHVGSQLGDPTRFPVAIATTLALMDELEAALPVRFDTLDIGGGFPVSYDSDATDLETLAAGIRPLLAPRASQLDIIAEPGRILVAEAMTLVTSVIGTSERADGLWHYLDDGVYGSYSNVVAEDVHPLIFALAEVTASGTDPVGGRMPRPVTLAGPTCDSADVIARGALLPPLEPGDMLVSPAMGAYTAVTATDFNGRTRAAIVVLDDGDAG